MESSCEEFKEVFPPDTKVISICGTREKFEAIVRCRCRDKDEFLETWLKPFQVMNNVGLRTSVTRPRAGKVVLYKAAFRCQHNTYPKSHKRVKKSHKKHTNCPAILKVTIKAPTENRRIRDKDKLRSEFPTLIVIIHNHNHDVTESKNILLHKRSTLTSSNKNLEKFLVPVIKNISDDHEYVCEVSTMKDYVSEEFVKTENSCENSRIVNECRILNMNEFPNISETTVNGSTSVPVSSWFGLKERFYKLFKKWEVKKSVEHYEALQVALLYLENHDAENSDSSSVISINRKTSDTNYHQNNQASGIVVIEFPKKELPKVEKEAVIVEKLSDNILSTDSVRKFSTENENLTDGSFEGLLLPNVCEIQIEDVKENTNESLFLQDHGYVIIDKQLKKNNFNSKVIKNLVNV